MNCWVGFKSGTQYYVYICLKIYKDNAMAKTHESEEDKRNESVVININGELVKRKDASISVFDSGFLLGDGIWEGLRLYNEKTTKCIQMFTPD